MWRSSYAKHVLEFAVWYKCQTVARTIYIPSNDWMLITNNVLTSLNKLQEWNHSPCVCVWMCMCFRLIISESKFCQHYSRCAFSSQNHNDVLRLYLGVIIVSRFRGCAWLIDEVWIGWLCLLTAYTHTTRDYRQYSAIAILHTLHFTVTHALGFSVFTSRILATDL
jgi:hypothetical protein